MNPDGLISAFKREVIERTPQKLKIACLLQIGGLFPKSPFFAGFGNKTTDAISYRSIGIDFSKIFIINDKGEVAQLNNTEKKTYISINQSINEHFPLIK